MPATDKQVKLAANGEAIDRWNKKLFRAANELQKLHAQRKRLLGPRKVDTKPVKYRSLDEIRMSMGGSEFPIDDIPL